MDTSTHIPLTSSELGNLWMTFHNRTMLTVFLEHFLEHADNEETKQILLKSYNRSKQFVESIQQLFEQENAVIPDGFTDSDFHKGTPKLFDYLYDIMFLHMLSKIETSLAAFHFTMSYRADIRQFYRNLTIDAQESYEQCTQLLLDKGVLSRPPYVTMPNEVSYVQSQQYLSGYSLMKEVRPLNTTEVSLIHHAIETNLVGMQLMIGFAQVAKDKQVKEYFIKGMKLSKKVETSLGEFLRREYIEPPATHAGKATTSTIAPFTDKIMMYMTSLLSTFGLGSNALGGAFSLRSDLPAKLALLGKDIVQFAKEGGQIMIDNHWMEEPPHVEDRRQLTKG